MAWSAIFERQPHGISLASHGNPSLVGRMFAKNPRCCALALCLIGAFGASPALAQLPALQEKLWLGHFLGSENRNCHFGVTSEGAAAFKVIGKNGKTIGSHSDIEVYFLVKEILPDGKTSERRLLPESLTSDQPATTKIKDVVIRGKVRGDASVEIFVTEERGQISLGGRIVDPGPLTKNPLQFAIEMKFEDFYRNTKTPEDKKSIKEFEEKTKNDRLQLVLIDKKRIKQAPSEPVDATALSGPGVAAMALEMGTYQGKSCELVASENSSIMLFNQETKPLHSGFRTSWSPDAAKDPTGKARLNVAIK
jgi:hypothetical protein